MTDRRSIAALSRGARVRAWVLLAAALLMPVQAVGQTFGQAEAKLLEIGDTVRLAVEGRPDLDLVLTLDESGRVAVPQAGQILLAGLSVDDAGRVLRQRLRVFDPNLDSVEVWRVDSRPLAIQVQGEVNNPGVYTFDTNPTVWDVARAAGGSLDTAALSLARVIREEAGNARILRVDLSSLVLGGPIPEFAFQDGDVLVIPVREEGTSQVLPVSGTQVFGAVVAPSVVHLPSPRPLLDVLMMAGSPRPEARLDEIWLVHPEDGRYQSTLVDLTLYLEDGDPSGNPLVYPGDTLNVAFEEENWLRRYGPLLLGSVTAMTTLWLAYDRATE